METSTRIVTLSIVLRDAAINGDLESPPDPSGLVVFAHGSGSSRFSRRNRAVAQVLQRAGLATVLLDLLTTEEERIDQRTGEHRFDLPKLAQRVIGTVDWLLAQDELARLPLGFFGASTGAGAALLAAAARPDVTRAVVSRGGRPDLAGNALAVVEAPTLLIVGGDDTQVIDLNREAMQRMRGKVRLEVVPGASHLFEEKGALEQVARLAGEWFSEHLQGDRLPYGRHG